MITLYFSRYLLIYLILIHLLSVSVLFVTDLVLTLKLLLVILIIYSFFYGLRRYILLSNDKSIVSLKAIYRKQWMLLNKAAVAHMAELKAYYPLGSFCVILVFSIPEQIMTVSVPVFCDAVSEEQMVLLSYWLFQLQKT